jgi:hypothetical protein
MLYGFLYAHQNLQAPGDQHSQETPHTHMDQNVGLESFAALSNLDDHGVHDHTSMHHLPH